MGSLSPRTRNAQVALYQSGEVDFLVATDAIGMGLNMDVDHVAFAGLRKFDGKRTRFLHPQEIGQIAGRAGRYQRDGTFGVTGEAEDMDEDLVQAVEEHRFEPVAGAEWRNSKLEFSSLATLLRSLDKTPDREGLKLSAPALDEITLRQLVGDPDIADRAKGRAAIERLWDVCQTPDFRKVALEEHLRLTRDFFLHLTTSRQRIPEDWIAQQYKGLDRTDGEIDTLAARLSSVRTLAYVANRPDWLAEPAHWQGKTRGLEDRLSDTLHEKLMARFVDRRTSALMRGLRVREDMLAGVGSDGVVTVEGHYVGKLTGVQFDPAQGSSVLEEKALRAAATHAVTPEIARRLGALAAEPDNAFALNPDGVVLWRGEAAGVLAGGQPFSPRVRLLGELGHDAARQRATQRLEAFVAAEASRRLAGLRRLEAAVAEGTVKGLARGLAYRLIEAGGVLDRAAVRAEAKALSQVERRMLRGLGVRLGAFSIFMPGLFKPQAGRWSRRWRRARPAAGDRPWTVRARCRRRSPRPAPLAAFGLRAVRSLAVPVEQLERLDELLRAGVKQSGGVILAEQGRGELGWTDPQAAEILRGLGFAPVNKPKAGEPVAWRRRAAHDAAPEARKPAAPPFALRRAGCAQGSAPAGPPAAPPRQSQAGRPPVSEEACRADVWLWRARFFKTRSLAAKVCEEGRVRLTRSGQESRLDKPARPVKVGDNLVFALGGRAYRRARRSHWRTPRPAGRSACAVLGARRRLKDKVAFIGPRRAGNPRCDWRAGPYRTAQNSWGRGGPAGIDNARPDREKPARS